jgi:hypothetical protein
MAEQNTPSFAVDADITPLQGRYFQYAKTGITDPRVRAQAYGIIKQSFGNIQQVRDAQRIRQQEEEDRALTMDVKRAQLDEGRLQLSMARDKFRRQQEAAQTGGSIYASFDAIRQDPNLRSEEKARQIYDIAAQNPDFFTDNPAAANKLNFTLNSIAPASKFSGEKVKDQMAIYGEARRLVGAGASPDSLTSAGFDVNDPVIKDILAKQTQTAADAAQKKEKETAEERRRLTAAATDIAKDYKNDIDSLNVIPDQAPSESNIEWDQIDNALAELDSLNLVSDQDKKSLENVGIRTFNPDAALPAARSPEDYKKLREQQYKAVKGVFRRATIAKTQSPANQPAQTGVNVRNLAQ